MIDYVNNQAESYLIVSDSECNFDRFNGLDIVGLIMNVIERDAKFHRRLALADYSQADHGPCQPYECFQLILPSAVVRISYSSNGKNSSWCEYFSLFAEIKKLLNSKGIEVKFSEPDELFIEDQSGVPFELLNVERNVLGSGRVSLIGDVPYRVYLEQIFSPNAFKLFNNLNLYIKGAGTDPDNLFWSLSTQTSSGEEVRYGIEFINGGIMLKAEEEMTTIEDEKELSLQIQLGNLEIKESDFLKLRPGCSIQFSKDNNYLGYLVDNQRSEIARIELVVEEQATKINVLEVY